RGPEPQAAVAGQSYEHLRRQTAAAVLGAPRQQGRPTRRLESRRRAGRILGTLQPGRRPHGNAQPRSTAARKNPTTGRTLARLGPALRRAGLGRTAKAAAPTLPVTARGVNRPVAPP